MPVGSKHPSKTTGMAFSVIGTISTVSTLEPALPLESRRATGGSLDDPAAPESKLSPMHVDWEHIISGVSDPHPAPPSTTPHCMSTDSNGFHEGAELFMGIPSPSSTCPIGILEFETILLESLSSPISPPVSRILPQTESVQSLNFNFFIFPV